LPALLFREVCERAPEGFLRESDRLRCNAAQESRKFPLNGIGIGRDGIAPALLRSPAARRRAPAFHAPTPSAVPSPAAGSGSPNSSQSSMSIVVSMDHRSPPNLDSATLRGERTPRSM